MDAQTIVQSSSVVQVSLIEVFAVLGVVVALIGGIGKLLVAQVVKAIRAQNESLNAEIAQLKRVTDELETQVEQLNRNLPLEYVRREDWIRFSASIDMKLDRLAAILMQRSAGGGS